MPGILALDLGTRTGWALWVPGHPIVHGYADFKPGRFDGAGMRYLRFTRWLNELHAGNAFSEVHYEEVRRHIGTDAAHVYGGLMGALQAWCETVRVPYQGVPVGTIKRHATGKGNADKAAMVAAMQALGHPVTDDNEADALALLYCVRRAEDFPAAGRTTSNAR